MKASRKKESALDRRLEELEEEARMIRSRFKTLDKDRKRGGKGLARFRREEGPGDSHASANREWPGGASLEDVSGNSNAEQGDSCAGERTYARPKSRVHGDTRFAHYFATGSFKPLTPIGQDRSIQRNKAIFMIVIVLIFGYIIYYALIR